MANPTPDETSPPSASAPGSAAAAPPGPELRLVDRKAFIALGSFDLAEGLRVGDLSMQIPNVTFPFNLTGGASRFQKQRCLFGQLDLEIAPTRLKAVEAAVLRFAPELSELAVRARAGFLEAEGLLRSSSGREPTRFTCRVAFDADGDGVAVRCFDVRLYSLSEMPAPLVAGLLIRALVGSAVVPGAVPRGLGVAAVSPVAEILRRTVPQRGFRLPEASAARLASALVSPQNLVLRFSAGAAPPGGLADEDLLLASEGSTSFEEGEALLRDGALGKARDFYLRAGELAQAHPFATERLVALLLGDPDVADYALDLVRGLSTRRPLSPAPLWMEAQLRQLRGETDLAAQRYLNLAAVARSRGEESSAFWAAEAAATLARRSPALAVRALHEALGLRPDHYPSLEALAAMAEEAGDPVAAIRAYRRLTAVAREPARAARAHVKLGRLCVEVEKDPAGGRLHLDAALRLEPDYPDALLALADLCAHTGEPLRALRCLDRVREVAAGDASLMARADLESGLLFEKALNNPENALARFQKSARSLPEDPAPLLHLGRVAERLGRLPEAGDALVRALELVGDPPRTAGVALAHEAHRILARMARDRLRDPARHRSHLEAAVRLQPGDAEAWEELVPLLRADESFSALAAGLEALAGSAEPRRRAVLLVEAADLHRLRLDDAARSRSLLDRALQAEPRSRAALEALIALDEAANDGPALADHLRALIEISPPGPVRMPLLRRLAIAARDGKKDVELAAHAFQELLTLTPGDVPALHELVTLQRRRGDLPGLASALEQLARASEATGDHGGTALALRELAQLYDGRLGRREEALGVLEKARGLSPGDLRILGDLADLALRLGRHRVARESYRTLVAAQGVDEPTSRRADTLERLARASEAAGDVSEAISALERAYALVGDDGIAERLDQLLLRTQRDDARAELCRTRAAALSRAGKASQAASLLATAGALHRALGSTTSASSDFAASLAAEPTGATARVALEALAGLAAEAGQSEMAATHLSGLARLTPEPRGAARLLLRAAELCRPSDTARAMDLWREAVERDPAFAPARRLLAQAHAARGQLRLASRELEAALEVDPRDPDALSPAEALDAEWSSALYARDAGDLEVCQRILSRRLAQRPEDRSALRELVAVLRQRNDLPTLAQALLQLERSVAPGEAMEIARELADLFARTRHPADAAAAYRRVLALHPQDRDALIHLAALLDSPADMEERAQVLEALIRVTPAGVEAAELHYRRGEVLRSLARVPEAMEAFERAARDASDPAPALEQLARAAAESGSRPAYLRALAERALLAAQRGEADAGSRLLEAAEAHLESRDDDGAIRCLERMMELVPNAEHQARGHRLLADVERRRGHLERALAHLQQLARAAPADREAVLKEVARSALDLGDLEVAREALVDALRRAPSDLELLGGLADVQRRLNDAEGEADTRVRLASSADATDRVPHLLRAAELLAAPAPVRAESVLRKAIQISGGAPEPRRRLGEMLAEWGRAGEAIEVLAEAAAALPATDAGPMYLRLSELAERTVGDLGLGLRFARLAASADPNSPAVAERLADAAYLAGSRDEAALALVRALDGSAPDEWPDLWVARALRLCEMRGAQGQPEAALRWAERASQLAPWRGDVALARFECQRPSDARGAVEALCNHAEALHPGQGAHRMLVIASGEVQRQGDLPRAAHLLKAALESEPDVVGVEEQLIGLYLRQDDLPAATALLQQQGRRALDSGDLDGALLAQRDAAELMERGGRFEQAAQLLDDLAAVLIRAGRTTEAASALVRRAELFRDALRDTARAETELRRALDLDPGSLDPLRLLQSMYQARGDFEAESESLLAEASHLEDGRRLSRVLLRVAELSAGPLRKPAEAERALTRVLSIEPGLETARLLWEQLLRSEGRWMELARSLRARAEHEDHLTRRVQLLRDAAQLFQSCGEVIPAADALEQARVSAPDDLTLAAETAQALREAGRDEASALVDAALLARDPTSEASFRRERERRQKAGDRRGEATLLQARALAEPVLTSVERFLSAADLFEAARDVEAARRCALWAFERDSSSPTAFERASHYFQSPQDAVGLASILARRAMAVEAEAPELHLRRARVLADAGDLDAACSAADEALAVDAGSAPRVDALLLRADLEAQRGGPPAASRFDERLTYRSELPAAVLSRIRCRLAEARTAAGLDEDAAALWEAAVAEAPPEQARAIHDRLMAAYLRLGDTRGQAKVMLAQANLAPDQRVPLLRSAVELLGKGTASETGPLALVALRSLAEAEPNDDQIWRRLAAIERDLGDLASAQGSLVRAAGVAFLRPDRAGLLLEAAAVAESRADPVEARRLRAEARRVDPAHPEALRLSLPDLRAERAPELGAVLSALIELEPRGAQRTAYRRERVQLLRSSDRDQTIAELGRWVEDASGAERAEPLGLLEGLLQEADRSAERAAVLEGLAALDPAPMPRWMEAAQAWGSVEKPRDALRCLQQAVRAESDPEPLRRLAELTHDLGEHLLEADAREQWAEWLSGGERTAQRVAAARAWLIGGRVDRARDAVKDVAAPGELLTQIALQTEAPEDVALLMQAFDAPGAPPARAELALLLADRAAPSAERERWLRSALELVPHLPRALQALKSALASRQAWSDLGELLDLEPPGEVENATEAVEAWQRASKPGRALASWVRHCRSAPGDAAWRRALEMAEALGEQQDAVREALLALKDLEQEPGARARVVRRLSEVLEAGGDAAHALEVLREGAAELPLDGELTERLVDRLEQRGEWVEIAQRLAPAAAPGLRLRRARALVELAGRGSAEARREALGVLLPRLTEPGVEELVRRAAQEAGEARAEVLGQWADALAGGARAQVLLELADHAQGPGLGTALEGALSADPGNARAFARLRELRIAEGDDAALSRLLAAQAAAEAGPRRAGLLAELGQLREGHLEDLEGAAQAYEDSLRASFDMHVARDLAELSLDLGRVDRARELFDILHRQGGPEYRLQATEHLADLETAAGRVAEALPYLQELAELEKTEGWVERLIAAARSLGRSEVEEAGLVQLDGLEISAEARTRVITRLAELAAARLDIPAESALLWRLVDLREDPAVLRRLAELETARGRHAEALKAATRWAAADPTAEGRSGAHLRVAQVHAAEGDWEGACREAAQACAALPGSREALDAWCRMAISGKRPRDLIAAAAELEAQGGVDALLPIASPLIAAYASVGDSGAAYRFARDASRRTPDDLDVLRRAAELAVDSAPLSERVELGRALAAREPSRQSSKTLRELSRLATAAGDSPLAAGLLSEALKSAPPGPEEIDEVLAALRAGGRAPEAATRAAQFALESPSDVSRWERLEPLAVEAGAEAFAAAAAAVKLFLSGKLVGGARGLDEGALPRVMSRIPQAWRTRLLAEGRERWQRAPEAPPKAKPSQALAQRIARIAERLGIEAPVARIDPASQSFEMGYAANRDLVVPASQLGLPPGAQEYGLALALARAMLGLPFLAADDLSTWSSQIGDAAPPPALLQKTAEAMAAVVVGDPLGAIVASAASDARFARADPRAWDRKVAFGARGHRGVAAYLVGALLASSGSASTG